MALKETNLEKLKALQLTLDKIEKNFGKGSIMKLGDNQVENIPVIPSGSIALDKALGVGGYPKGRVIEIYGPESSGKTTLAIHAIAEAQKQGGIAAIIDAEHAFDRSYAEKLGVDVENLFISQPDNGEQALEIADQLIRSAAIDIIVIDSVAALTPKAEIEGMIYKASQAPNRGGWYQVSSPPENGLLTVHKTHYDKHDLYPSAGKGFQFHPAPEFPL